MTILPLVATALAWWKIIGANNVANLASAIIAMLILPGFLIFELVFPKLALKIGALERIPLFFGLAMGFWTLIAAIAYCLRLSSDFVIGSVLLADLIGLFAVFFLKRKAYVVPILSTEINKRPSINRINFVIIAIIMVGVAVLVGYSSQFHMLDADTYYHLAGFRKIADSPSIIGGNVILGPKYPSYPHYVSNPWYLVAGLTARLAHAQVAWLYVFLSTILTVFMLLAFYSMLNILVDDYRVAFMGTLIFIIPFVYQLVAQLNHHTYFYAQTMPYPATVSQMILFPLATTYCLRYTFFGERETWSATAVLSAATMAQHVQFIVWVPCILGLVIIVSLLFINTWNAGLNKVLLLIEISFLAATIGYLVITFPLASALKAITMNENTLRLLLTKGFYRLGEKIFIYNPQYLLYRGWAEILCLTLVFLLQSYQVSEVIRERSQKWSPFFSLSINRQNKLWLHASVVAAALFGPWLIVFNPYLVPYFVKLFNSPIPVGRMLSANLVLSNVIIISAIAYILFLLFTKYRAIKCFNFTKLIPLLILSVCIGTFFLIPRARAELTNILNNHDNYPNILKLSDKFPYRELSRLKPGIVAVRIEQAGIVAAMTPHYVVATVWFRIGDHRIIEKRLKDNEKIYTFSVPPGEMRRLLDNYRCRYIITLSNSPQVQLFRKHKELFNEILATETDIVFEVKP